MGSKPVGISASRASAILGLNSYQSPFEVWQRIMEERKPGFNAAMGYLLPPEADNAAIRWGKAFEDAVISLAESAMGAEIMDRERFYSATPGGIELTCHIDGQYSDGKLHEGKTTSFFAWKDKWGEPGSEDVPMEYYIQVQHQMICTGAEGAIVSVLVFPKRVEEFEKDGWIVAEFDYGGKKYGLGKGGQSYYPEECIQKPIEWATHLNDMGYFHQYPIQANKKLQKKLIDLYNKWWQDYVIKEIPPTDGITYEDIRRLCPCPIGTIVCDREIAKDFARYKKAGKIGGKIKKRQEELRAGLLLKLKDKQGVEDEDSAKKWVFVDECGDKLGQFDGKTFRVS